MSGKAFAPSNPFIEWPTLLLVIAVYAGLAAVTLNGAALGWLAVPLAGVLLAQHSSLQHEVLHGHPFRSQRLSDALVFPAVGLFVPYERFRDTHLAHHRDEFLTDPYDDPESNFLDPVVWAELPGWRKALLRANNTLLGRMVLGPAIGMTAFYADDFRRMRRGEWRVTRGYLLHAAGLVPVLAWLGAVSTMPAWQYVVACYLGLSLLKIRTFLEHRAHERAAGRSVIIEDRGPLALLFLNNNFHAVHHACPKVAWYRLPELYRARRDEFLRRNRAYLYRSYAEVFGRHLLTAKDPVPHPLRPGPGQDRSAAIRPISAAVDGSVSPAAPSFSAPMSGVASSLPSSTPH